MTPEALRRRMAHGNIYKPEKIDAALGNYFRPGNLAALRELALLWVADRVDEALGEYRERHGITEPWETRERVLVAITGAPGTETLIRRAARMAQRAHGELLGLHVTTADGLAGPRSENLERHRKLLADLGGEYHEVVASDVAAALAEFARAQNCTQLVLGASRRSRWTELDPRIGHQPRGPARGPDRRARDLARADGDRGTHCPSRRPALRVAVAALPPAAGRRLGARARSGCPLLTLAARPGARRHRARDGAAALPARSSSRSARSAGSCPASSRRSPASCSRTSTSRRRSTRGRSPRARTCSRSSCSSS